MFVELSVFLVPLAFHVKIDLLRSSESKFNAESKNQCFQKILHRFHVPSLF